MDCIFCKIIKGEIPSVKIYEDTNYLAFLDIQPNNPGHTLVVPKKHSRNIFDIESSDLLGLYEIVKKISAAVKNGVSADGINITMNNEPAAGQIVFHTHTHIIPRFKDDGYKHWGHKNYKEGEIEEVAKKIREKIII